MKNYGEIEKTNLHLNGVVFLIENFQLEQSCSSEDLAKYKFFIVSYYIDFFFNDLLALKLHYSLNVPSV